MIHATVMTRSRIVVLAGILLATAGFALAQDEPVGPPPLSIQPGTVLTIRINDALSSDHNQPGDVFSGSLTQPVVVQGIVVAQRGQTVSGRVVEAKRAGMVSGTSHLRLALTRLSLVDGQSLQIRTQMMVRNGPRSERRDAAAIAGSTGLGAAIGGAAGWGRGAAIGAGAGAAAGVAGVLLTRGYQTVVYPETVLTFEITAPVEVDTSAAPQAFHAVDPNQYSQAAPPAQATPVPPVGVAPPVVVAGPPVYAPYPYPYPYPYYGPYSYYGPYAYDPYPYYYGPSVGFVFGHPVRFGRRPVVVFRGPVSHHRVFHHGGNRRPHR